MAFCGRCGQFLNTNITICPRCGTHTDVEAAVPEILTDDSATILTHAEHPQPGRASHTPLPQSPDATKAVHYTVPDKNVYPGQQPPPSGYQAGDNSYPTPGAFNPTFPSVGNPSSVPGSSSRNLMPQAHNANSTQHMYQPGGVMPMTDPGYPYQPPTPVRKTSRGLILIIIVLIVALVAVTGLLFIGGPDQFAALFGTKNTPTPQGTTPGQLAPTTAPSQQSSTTPPSSSTQQAQATIQQYYADINKQDFQDAYSLWVSNPNTYDNFKQGFAHTHHDAIVLGEPVPQIDGTIQVYLTIQATEDATGGGTKTSIYQGYYTVGQQPDGSWKIINGQLG